MLLKGKHKDTIERYKNNKFRNSIDKYYNISQFADSILTDAQNYIMVYDLNGRFVETLVNSNQSAGIYSVNWNAEHLPSSAYFIKMNTESYTKIQKVMLVK
jgi:hypothetical protein